MERKNYSGIFLFFFLISVFFLVLWQAGSLNYAAGVISKITGTPGSIVISKLNKEDKSNLDKISEKLSMVKLDRENKALRDQFETTNPQSSNLLPAKIIGLPAFVPTQTIPDFYVLDKGERDGVKKGAAIVWKDNLIGQVKDVSDYSSKVTLITARPVSFTGKLMSEAVGVVRGTGNGVEIENILLSENLEKDDLVLTKGSKETSGIGIPPDLVVGKIVSVDKNPSALFQTAEVESLLDFTKLNTVFIVVR